MTILAVFRSRAQALDFLSLLRQSGIRCSAVNTPKEAGYGCGISVKFDGKDLFQAKSVLARRPYSSFAGFLKGAGGSYVSL